MQAGRELRGLVDYPGQGLSCPWPAGVREARRRDPAAARVPLHSDESVSESRWKTAHWVHKRLET